MTYSTIRTNKTVIFLICCLAFITNGLLGVLPSSSLAVLAANTHVALSTAGIVFTVSALGSIIAVLLSNLLIKKVGTKNLMIMGLGGLILASMLIPTTGSFDIWLIAQLIQGMSSSLITVGLCMTLTFNFKETLGEKMNVLHGAAGMGSLLAPLVLANALSLTGTILPSFLLVALISGLSILLLSPLCFTNRPQAMSVERGVEKKQDQPAGLSMGRLCKNPIIWFTALQVLFYVGAESGFSNWLVTSISQGSHMALAAATPAATLFWIGLTVGRMAIAQLLKRNLISDARLLYVSFAGGAASGLCVIFYIQLPLVSFVASCFLGFFLGPIFPSLQTIASRRFEHAAGFISSIVLLSSGLAGMTVPMSIGLIIPQLGVRGGMLIPAIMSISICVPFYCANRKARHMQQSERTIKQPIHEDIADMPTVKIGCVPVAA